MLHSYRDTEAGDSAILAVAAEGCGIIAMRGFRFVASAFHPGLSLRHRLVVRKISWQPTNPGNVTMNDLLRNQAERREGAAAVR